MGSTDFPSAASPIDALGDIRNMVVRVERFEARHLPLVQQFAERYWKRPRTEAFYRWRYLDCLPFSRMYLAIGEDRCLGMVFALRKQYLFEAQPATCLEVFDWHSLPGLKGSGVGIRVMRAMMREGERLIAIGGTADVLKTLPAMGWQTIGSARSYELPVSGAALESSLRSRIRVAIPGARVALQLFASAWFTPRARRRRGCDRAVPAEDVGAELLGLYDRPTGYDVLQMPDADVLRWAGAGPTSGRFALLHFLSDERPCGWALTRTYDAPEGREAAILDLFAPGADDELYTWMVSEAAAAVMPLGPRVIRARAACPVLQRALLANRFRPGHEAPVHTWPKMQRPNLRLHVTLNHTDEPLRPYVVPSDALTNRANVFGNATSRAVGIRQG